MIGALVGDIVKVEIIVINWFGLYFFITYKILKNVIITINRTKVYMILYIVNDFYIHYLYILYLCIYIFICCLIYY